MAIKRENRMLARATKSRQINSKNEFIWLAQYEMIKLLQAWVRSVFAVHKFG